MALENSLLVELYYVHHYTGKSLAGRALVSVSSRMNSLLVEL